MSLIIEVACIEMLYGAFPHEEAELRSVFDKCKGVYLSLSKILPDIVKCSMNIFGANSFDNIVIVGINEIHEELNLGFEEEFCKNVMQIFSSRSFHCPVSINDMMSAFSMKFSEEKFTEENKLHISMLVEYAIKLCYLAIITKQNDLARKMKAIICDMILKGNYPLGYRNNNLVILSSE